ncbi:MULTISPECIES: ribosome assembly cofactor RimP [Tenacibaculum]|uniref:ribosome assembly cofactor RimP n=1 Tax=Tenacibaculum TaxID=104267 RepID=UPI001F0AF20B|nr:MULTISPECIES: ribosome assembly cofactor RimP [Tenacibaculum]MCH3881716.1 ribosome assembly cofactor RimP [Tenacibaculum aquimarinum]MCH3883372.1 ribosome assembly cofactor RimP [Tenacibaculum aquimarinum]MDO6598716.1 ribosome assembly cofactor RimP [Tenacibaculum sp. 1_MG-2023]
MNQDTVKKLLQEALDENPSLFLIELAFLASSKIKVVVDGDAGVPLSECIRISRSIEGSLDREEEDFSLEVTSPDIAHPFLVLRQYKKNIGRIIKVVTAEDKYEGTLASADEDGIVLTWKAREPKPIGKGKHTVEKTLNLLYSEIKEARVKIIF